MLEQMGRFPKFKVNRKLTEAECNTHLNQDTPVDNQVHFQFSANSCAEFMTTIKMNSSYLEVVDRLYVRRGTYMFGGAVFLWLALFVTALAIVIPNNSPMIYYVPLVGTVLSVTYGLAYFFLKQEMFNWTHNPIRFDRRNRMVYAFLYHKKMVVTVPWEKVVFCLGSNKDYKHEEFDIRGHVMADDGQGGVNVIATFALGHITNDRYELIRYWDFICIYMGRGPEELVDTFRFCLPIADRKEPLVWGINNDIRQLGPLFYVMFPISVLCVVGRFLAMLTSRIPVWPDWVEEHCHIDPNDPYVRDASTNPPVYPFTDHSASHSCYEPYRDRPNVIGITLACILGCLTTGLFMWVVYTIKMNT